MNRRGDEYVEAGMVLPILLLTILSLIMLLIYFFSCLNAQTDMHRTLLKEQRQPVVIFDIKEKSTETSSKIGGAVSLIMHKEIKGRVYCIGEAGAIRLGAMAWDDEEE